MRPILISCAAAVGLTACVPFSTYYKQGVTLERLEKDQTRCEVAALNEVPVAFKTVREPPIFIPAEEICDRNGNCRILGAEVIPGRSKQVDVNANLRARVAGQCMIKRGYQQIELPACPSRVRASGTTQVLPPLSDTSCVIRQRSGGFAIVDP